MQKPWENFFDKKTDCAEQSGFVSPTPDFKFWIVFIKIM